MLHAFLKDFISDLLGPRFGEDVSGIQIYYHNSEMDFETSEAYLDIIVMIL